MLKREVYMGYYLVYACEKGAECGFMTWDMPTEFDCPSCGHTMFKKSGRGRMKPFCVNEACPNFLPEDQRGYRKKAKEGDQTEEPAAQAEGPHPERNAEEAPKKGMAKKTAAKKTTVRQNKRKVRGGLQMTEVKDYAGLQAARRPGSWPNGTFPFASWK